MPDGQSLHLHPMAFAAWFGLLATALNLFPVDSSMAATSPTRCSGRHARWISAAPFLGSVALAVRVAQLGGVGGGDGGA